MTRATSRRVLGPATRGAIARWKQTLAKTSTTRWFRERRTVRSLTSTVVVQASQAEQSQVQTRRVANHNHCHALTIQYYEVLRHFRINTEFVRLAESHSDSFYAV